MVSLVPYKKPNMFVFPHSIHCRGKKKKKIKWHFFFELARTHGKKDQNPIKTGIKFFPNQKWKEKPWKNQTSSSPVKERLRLTSSCSKPEMFTQTFRFMGMKYLLVLVATNPIHDKFVFLVISQHGFEFIHYFTVWWNKLRKSISQAVITISLFWKKIWECHSNGSKILIGYIGLWLMAFYVHFILYYLVSNN
jgi:hypothetical protein